MLLTLLILSAFTFYKLLKVFTTLFNKKKYFCDDSKNISSKHIDCNKDGYDPWHVAPDIWSILVPYFGTKWAYFWKYNISNIHEIYRGKLEHFLLN